MAEYVINPLCLIAITPVLLGSWGGGGLGVWYLYLALASIAGTFAAGIIPPVLRRAASARALNAQYAPMVEPILAAAIAIALTVGFSAAAISIVYLAALPEASVGVASREVDLVMLALLIHSVSDSADAVAVSMLRASEKFRASAIIELLGRALFYACPFVVATLGESAVFGILGAASASVVRPIVRMTAVLVITKARITLPRWSVAMELLADVKWTWIASAGAFGYLIVDKMLVASLFSSIELAAYGVAAQLATQVQALPAAALGAMVPRVSRAYQMHAAAESFKLMKRGIVESVAIASVLLFALLLFGDDLLKIWVGTEMAAAAWPILLALGVSAWLQSFSISPYFTLMGAGGFRALAVVGLLAAMASLIGMAVGGMIYALIGMAIGRSAYGLVSLAYFAFAIPKINAHLEGGQK
ncbi:MAG: hypothetical protein RR354_05365 [Mucinivorans sp.]